MDIDPSSKTHLRVVSVHLKRFWIGTFVVVVFNCNTGEIVIGFANATTISVYCEQWDLELQNYLYLLSGRHQVCRSTNPVRKWLRRLTVSDSHQTKKI